MNQAVLELDNENTRAYILSTYNKTFGDRVVKNNLKSKFCVGSIIQNDTEHYRIINTDMINIMRIEFYYVLQLFDIKLNKTIQGLVNTKCVFECKLNNATLVYEP